MIVQSILAGGVLVCASGYGLYTVNVTSYPFAFSACVGCLGHGLYHVYIGVTRNKLRRQIFFGRGSVPDSNRTNVLVRDPVPRSGSAPAALEHRTEDNQPHGDNFFRNDLFFDCLGLLRIPLILANIDFINKTGSTYIIAAHGLCIVPVLCDLLIDLGGIKSLDEFVYYPKNGPINLVFFGNILIQTYLFLNEENFLYLCIIGSEVTFQGCLNLRGWAGFSLPQIAADTLLCCLTGLILQ